MLQKYAGARASLVPRQHTFIVEASELTLQPLTHMSIGNFHRLQKDG